MRELMALDPRYSHQHQPDNPYTTDCGVWDLSGLFRGGFDSRFPLSGLARLVEQVDAATSDHRAPERPHSRARMSWLSYGLGQCHWSIGEVVEALRSTPGEEPGTGQRRVGRCSRAPRSCRVARTRQRWPGTFTVDTARVYTT